MAKTQKVRLILAATAFVALSLPRSSSAQPPPTPSGTWTGYESFEISVFDLISGHLLSSHSGAGPGTLFIGPAGTTGFTLLIISGAADVVGLGLLLPPDAFGPTSASGRIFLEAGPAGSTSGNFFLTYESILPNSQIDVGNGIAIADLTTTEFDFQLPVQTRTESFATFTPVPEPPSSVLAGLAILVVAAVAWMRRFRRRVQARLS
jgi:hypothetical protein